MSVSTPYVIIASIAILLGSFFWFLYHLVQEENAYAAKCHDSKGIVVRDNDSDRYCVNSSSFINIIK